MSNEGRDKGGTHWNQIKKYYDELRVSATGRKKGEVKGERKEEMESSESKWKGRKGRKIKRRKSRKEKGWERREWKGR